MQMMQKHAADTRWTADSLHACMAAYFGTGSLVVVANRAPVRYEHGADGRLIERRASGGLVTALEPLMSASQGVWVAHDDDPLARCHSEAPPGQDADYRVRRVRLSAPQQRGYYNGFANEGLWPLCHHVHVRPIFRSQDFADYRTANARFADAACEEAGTPTPLMLVQDYHLALAPKMIRHRRPQSTIVAFWHVPFPPARQFAICPWAKQLVEGLLGSSIVGFQTQQDCDNFLETAEAMTGAAVNGSRAVVSYGGCHTFVRAYPASVDWPRASIADAPPVPSCRSEIQKRYGLPDEFQLIVGVDRLDYTKGLEEKLLVLERLLDWRREFRGRLVLLQVASPSRGNLPAYRATRAKLMATAERINQRFGAPGYRPIVIVEKTLDCPDVDRLLRAADVCYVGSLHDGMNLVAKEFVAARDDHRGVLVLSQFAGAMQELRSALIINPYDVDTSARVLARALRMPPVEQEHAMRQMRDVVAQANAYQWAGSIVSDAASLRL